MSETAMHDDRCANCGRFVEKDADGFYDREWPYHDTAHTVVYCDEGCCNAKRRKDRLEFGEAFAC